MERKVAYNRQRDKPQQENHHRREDPPFQGPLSDHFPQPPGERGPPDDLQEEDPQGRNYEEGDADQEEAEKGGEDQDRDGGQVEQKPPERVPQRIFPQKIGDSLDLGGDQCKGHHRKNEPEEKGKEQPQHLARGHSRGPSAQGLAQDRHGLPQVVELDGPSPDSGPFPGFDSAPQDNHVPSDDRTRLQRAIGADEDHIPTGLPGEDQLTSKENDVFVGLPLNHDPLLQADDLLVVNRLGGNDELLRYRENREAQEEKEEEKLIFSHSSDNP